MIAWVSVLSELFVNLSAGWFALVIIEPKLNPNLTLIELLSRLFSGIIALLIAKYLRQQQINYERF